LDARRARRAPAAAHRRFRGDAAGLTDAQTERVLPGLVLLVWWPISIRARPLPGRKQLERRFRRHAHALSSRDLRPCEQARRLRAGHAVPLSDQMIREARPSDAAQLHALLDQLDQETPPEVIEASLADRRHDRWVVAEAGAPLALVGCFRARLDPA